MTGRTGTILFLAFLAVVGFVGCAHPTTETRPKGNPYAECRSIIEFLRVHTGDTEMMVLGWGPREEVMDDTGKVEAVLIEARYRASIDGVSGVWSQQFRIEQKRVTEETSPVEERTDSSNGSSGEKGGK